MKEISMVVDHSVNLKITRITMEPGDRTRYDFFVIPYFDEFLITPCESTFRFVNRLSKWDVLAYKDKYETLNCDSIEDRFEMNEIAKQLCLNWQGINLNTIYHTANGIYRAFLKEEGK